MIPGELEWQMHIWSWLGISVSSWQISFKATLDSSALDMCEQGSADDELSPTCVFSLLGIPIASVAAGLWHTVCISVDGDVYSFGGNQFRQLGTGSDQAENQLGVKNHHANLQCNQIYIASSMALHNLPTVLLALFFSRYLKNEEGDAEHLDGVRHCGQSSNYQARYPRARFSLNLSSLFSSRPLSSNAGVPKLFR